MIKMPADIKEHLINLHKMQKIQASHPFVAQIKVPGLQSYANSVNQLICSDPSSSELANSIQAAVSSSIQKDGDAAKANEMGMSPEKMKVQLNTVAYENMLENMYYCKLQGIMGDEIYIKSLPCVVGRKQEDTDQTDPGLKINQQNIFSVNDRSLQNIQFYQNQQQQKKVLDPSQKNNCLYTADMDQMILSKSIDDQNQKFKDIENLDPEIRKLVGTADLTKVDIDSKSPAISENHFILKSCDSDPSSIQILALEEIYVNNQILRKEDGFQNLQNLDDIRIDGSPSSIPHIWKFIQIKQSDENQMGVYDAQEASRIQPFIKDAIHEIQKKVMSEQRKAYSALNKEIRKKNGLSCESIVDGVNYGQLCTSIFKKYPDISLHRSWSSMEKETLKKYLLQFGYGRWNKIRKISLSQDKILIKKTDDQMKAFSNDFIRTLFEYLQ